VECVGFKHITPLLHHYNLLSVPRILQHFELLERFERLELGSMRFLDILEKSGLLKEPYR
jgi:hypothetical protein